jgi:Undecaprenyl-phosphate glucose phosphotransferase
MSLLVNAEGFPKVAARHRLPPIALPGIVALGDSLALLLASLWSYSYYVHGVLGLEQGKFYSGAILMAEILTLFIFHESGLYRMDVLISPNLQARKVFVGWFLTAAILLTLGFLLQIVDDYSRGWAVLAYVTGLVSLLLVRVFFAQLIRHWRAAGLLARRTVVVGTGPHSAMLLRNLDQKADTDCRILGVFSEGIGSATGMIAGYPLLGDLDGLSAFVRDHDVDNVLVALPLIDGAQIDGIVKRVRLLPVDVQLVPDLQTLSQRKLTTSAWGDMTVINVASRPLQGWDALVKRSMDLLIAAIVLVLASPILIVAAIAVKLESRGPVFFRQKRFGFNNRVFEVIKFRTMYVDRGDLTGAQRTTRNDARVTRIGRFLRASSIDELPQIFNVLRGDMSIVGPRAHPIAMRAGDKLYHEAFADYVARHRVRPGITGWAQVNGLRGEIDTLEKARARVEYDLYYIENWSVWFDIQILFRTVAVVVTKDAY